MRIALAALKRRPSSETLLVRHEWPPLALGVGAPSTRTQRFTATLKLRSRWTPRGAIVSTKKGLLGCVIGTSVQKDASKAIFGAAERAFRRLGAKCGGLDRVGGTNHPEVTTDGPGSPISVRAAKPRQSRRRLVQ